MTTVLVGHCVYFSSQICYAFNYDDEVIMVFHPELVEDTIEDDVFNSIEILLASGGNDHSGPGENHQL